MIRCSENKPGYSKAQIIFHFAAIKSSFQRQLKIGDKFSMVKNSIARPTSVLTILRCSAYRQTSSMFRVRWLCFFLAIILRVSCQFQNKSNLQDFKSTGEVILCVEIIAREYFTRKENVLIVSGDSFITGEILRRMEPHFGINLADKNSRINFNTVRDYIVLEDQGATDPYEAVENMTLHPRGRFVILTKSKREVLEIAAGRFWRAGIPNVIFVQPSIDGTVKIFGYEISPRYSNLIRLYVLDHWKKNFVNGSNLFPCKFKNMKKHPLVVAVVNVQQMEPEIYVFRDNGESKINGVGSSLLNLFAEKLNFKIVVTEISYYGEKQEDGRWTGTMGEVIRGDADLTFAAILPGPKVVEDFEHSDFYRWDGLYFAMKIKGKTVSWKSIFEPLSFEVWTCQLIVLLTTLCLVWAVKKCWSMNMIKEYVKYIDVFKVLLNQNVRYPNYTGVRLAFALFLIYGYLSNTAYTGSLVKYLSTPKYQENPNTFEELENSRLEIAGPAAIKIFLCCTGDPVNRKIHDRLVDLTYPDFWKVLAAKDRAIVLYRTTVIIHNWRNRLNDSMRIHTLQDPIISLPLFYYMRKGHPYYDPLNHFIRQIHSSGLIIKWMADYDASNTQRRYEQESVVLTLEHLAGVFLILGCGYVVGITTLFLELCQG